MSYLILIDFCTGTICVHPMYIYYQSICYIYMHTFFHYTVPTEVPQNVTVTVESSRSIMLTWERPSLEEENGLLVRYHVIVIETEIHYTDNGTEITGMQRYLNTTYDVSKGRMQLINESIHPDYNYTVRIAAATEPGIGPFSDPVTVRTNMDGECNFDSAKYQLIDRLQLANI